MATKEITQLAIIKRNLTQVQNLNEARPRLKTGKIYHIYYLYGHIVKK